MELRQYGQILWRRWWLVAALLLVVLVVSVLTYRSPMPVYQATMRFAIGIEGDEPVSATSGDGRSDAWLASEYLADDLSEVLKGGEFAARVSQQVGLPVPVGSIFASREHRIMTVTVTGGNQDEVQTMAEAVGAAVQDGGSDYFPQLAGVHASAVRIDGPSIGQVGRSLRQKLDLPIRLLLALVAGIALAFLWDYMDNTVRDRAELEAMGIAVLGEIPHGPFWRRARRSGSGGEPRSGT